MTGRNLAAGGEAVTVAGSNLTLIVIVAVVALLALAVAGWLVRDVLAASKGTAKMQEIALAVQEGAAAYLRRQFRTLGVFVVLIYRENAPNVLEGFGFGAAATRTLPRTVRDMPVNPVSAENTAPITKNSDRPHRTPEPSAGSRSSTKKISTTNTPRVRNWRRR